MIYGRVMTPEGVVRVPVRVSVQRAGLPQFVLQGLPGQTRQLRQIILTAMKTTGWKMPHGRVVVDCQLPEKSVWGTPGLGLAVAVAVRQADVKTLELDVVGVLELDGSVTLPDELAPLLTPLGVPLLSAQPPQGLAGVMHQPSWMYCRALSEYIQSGGLPVRTDEFSPTLPPLMPSVGIDPLHLLCLSLVWAGGHSLLLFGSPGEGKTLSRSWLEALSPTLTKQQLLDRISVVGKWEESRHATVALPSPTDSVAKWIQPRTGWLRQGSQGAIWMDEFAALPVAVRTRLRGWIEDSDPETLSLRARNWQAAFVATMNPCSCGYWGEPRCVCSRAQMAQVLARVSWPLLDRFALQWRVESTLDQADSISRNDFRHLQQRIQRARDRQLQRSGRLNSTVGVAELPSAVLRREHAWRQRLSEWSARRQVQFCQVAQTLLDGEWHTSASEACETAWLICRGTEFLRKEHVTAR